MAGFCNVKPGVTTESDNGWGVAVFTRTKREGLHAM